MKNKITIILLTLMLLFTIVGCSNENTNNQIDSKNEIYDLAVESGYQGSYEDWLTLVKGDKGDRGDNGVGIQSITLTSSFNDVDIYTITFTDGTFTTYQVKNGANGAKGDKGEKGDQGEKGAQGEPGLPGSNGVSIISIVLTDRNDLADTYTITYSDNSISTFKVTNGAKGDKGDKGDKGESGITPKLRINESTNFWEVSYDNGVTWSSLGVKATSDSIGPKGESAFDIFKKYHPDYNGTEEQWINSMYKSGLYYNENAPETGEFKFARTAEGDSYYLVSYEGSDLCITVPDTYNGYPVTKILGGAFKNVAESRIEKLVLPNSFNGIVDKPNFIGLLREFSNGNSIQYVSVNTIQCDSIYFLENFSKFIFWDNGYYNYRYNVICHINVLEVNMGMEEFVTNYLNKGLYAAQYGNGSYYYNLENFKIKCNDAILDFSESDGTLNYNVKPIE